MAPQWQPPAIVILVLLVPLTTGSADLQLTTADLLRSRRGMLTSLGNDAAPLGAVGLRLELSLVMDARIPGTPYPINCSVSRPRSSYRTLTYSADAPRQSGAFSASRSASRARSGCCWMRNAAPVAGATGLIGTLSLWRLTGTGALGAKSPMEAINGVSIQAEAQG